MDEDALADALRRGASPPPRSTCSATNRSSPTARVERAEPADHAARGRIPLRPLGGGDRPVRRQPAPLRRQGEPLLNVVDKSAGYCTAVLRATCPRVRGSACRSRAVEQRAQVLHRVAAAVARMPDRTSREPAARGPPIISGVTTATPPAEPEIAVRTIADLPFHVLGRFQKPLAMGRVRGGEVEGVSSKELFEQRSRSVARAVGARAGARAIALRSISESRPEWILTDLAVIACRRRHRADLSDAVGGAGPLHPERLRRPHRGRVDAGAAREDAGGPPSAAGDRSGHPDRSRTGRSPEPVGAVLRRRARSAGHARMVAEWGVGA